MIAARTTNGALVVFMLAGCAAPYTPPASGPTARLRVAVGEANPAAATNVNQYKSGRCESPTLLGYFGGTLNFSDHGSIGMPGARFRSSDHFLERTIEASTRQLFSVRVLIPTKYCYVSFSFVPSSGYDYEAVVDWGRTECRVTVRRILGEEGDQPLTTSEALVNEAVCEKGFN